MVFESSKAYCHHFLAIKNKINYIGPLLREEYYGIDSTMPGKKQSF